LGIVGCGGGLGIITISAVIEVRTPRTPICEADGVSCHRMLSPVFNRELTVADNQDEALRLAKSLNCADLIIDARRTSAEEAEIIVNDVTAPRSNNGMGGCAATIVLPDSQRAFDFATKITRKHGIIMTVSVVWNCSGMY
jgi:hypothetical protein